MRINWQHPWENNKPYSATVRLKSTSGNWSWELKYANQNLWEHFVTIGILKAVSRLIICENLRFSNGNKLVINILFLLIEKFGSQLTLILGRILIQLFHHLGTKQLYTHRLLIDIL